jgi:hypothetical protein
MAGLNEDLFLNLPLFVLTTFALCIGLVIRPRATLLNGLCRCRTCHRPYRLPDCCDRKEPSS